jgi:hypothetical protein
MVGTALRAFAHPTNHGRYHALILATSASDTSKLA